MNEKETPTNQRDSARTERDVARGERDSAITELDDLKTRATASEENFIAQEHFIATVSHDLRNPVSCIKMAVEILKKDGKDQDLIALIERNANQAEELIKHLLDAHLVKSGEKLPITPGRCDLLPILRGCRDSLIPQLKAKVKLMFTEAEQIWGVWDGTALERAFSNLLNNAIKFGDSEKEVRITAKQESTDTSVGFQNFGEPISKENLLRIFDSHFRSKNKDIKKGWGLGLTVVKGIAEAHSGKIEVLSSESEGTIFTLRLPNGISLKV